MSESFLVQGTWVSVTWRMHILIEKERREMPIHTPVCLLLLLAETRSHAKKSLRIGKLCTAQKLIKSYPHRSSVHPACHITAVVFPDYSRHSIA